VTEPGAGDQEKRSDAGSGAGSVTVPPSSGSSGPIRPNPSRHDVQHSYREAHRHPWLRRGTIALAAGLVLVLVLVVVVYFKLNSNITQLDVSKMLGHSLSTDGAANLKPMNILVMGSDTRAGIGTNDFGTTADVSGARSDTTLIVHLSGDRQSAVVVSVPRDSMTRAPADCKSPNNPVAPDVWMKDGPIRQWNANFSLGGPACLIRTVEGNTGVRIDHFVVLNFLGFQSMVDALGSVQVCVPTPVNDSYSGLQLPAGRSEVNGKQALAFVRIRHNIGNDASDLGRISRQQAFLSAMVQEATSSKLILRPDKLIRFLDAATKSLTADPGMANLNSLREVAQSVSGLKTSQVRFVTVPIEDYPPDHNRVQWSADADALWKALRQDKPLPGSKPSPSTAPNGATVVPALKIRPDKITVQISNASGVTGRARQAAEDLRIQGFHINAYVTGPNLKTGVTVAYSSPYFEEARTVAAAFPGATLVKDESAGNIVQVTLGAGSPYVVQVPNRVGTTPLPTRAPAGAPTTAATPSPAVTIKARTADSNICAP
jgi:LCP family protein required for cell wall assembly